MRHLQIQQLHATQFGGWRNKSLTLPDAPFIVCFGANETGKSTIAELLTWLLVGTANTATKDPDRYGDPDTNVKGSLVGTFDGHRFESTGSFRIPRNTMVKDTDLRVVCGGSLDAAAWRAHLGGIDLSVVRGVYRLWGTDLHTGDGLASQLSRLALGEFGSRIDARVIAQKLVDQSAQLATGRAKDAESVRILTGQIDALNLLIREADRNADLAALCRDELARVDVERDAARHRSIAAVRTAAVAQRALEALGKRAVLRAAQASLEAFRGPHTGWIAVAADIPGLEHAQAVAASTAIAADVADQAAKRAAEALGAQSGILDAVVITDADLQSITRAVSELSAVEDTSRAAQAAVVHADQLAAAVSADVDRALDQVARLAPADERAPVERAAVQFANHDPASHSTIQTAVAEWAHQRSTIRDCDRRLAEAERSLTDALADRTAQEAAWVAWGTGSDAHTWRLGTASRNAPLAATPAWQRWLPVGVVVIIAILAIVVGRPALAAAAAVAAAILAFIARSTEHAAPSPWVPHASHAELDAASAAVIMATTRHGDAQRDLDTATAARDAARHQLAAAENNYRDTSAKLGHPRLSRPELVSPVLAAWAQANQLIERETMQRDAGAAARTNVVTVDTERRAAAHRVCQFLVKLRIPEPSDLRLAEALTAQYRHAVLLHQEAQHATTAATAAHCRADNMLAPVSDEIVGWSNARIVDAARQAAADAAHGQALRAEVEVAEAAYRVASGDGEAVAALLAEQPCVADLERLRIETNATELDANAIHQELSEHAGRLRAQQAELVGVDQIAVRIEDQGGLIERREALAIQAYSLRAAAGLLRTVAERYERENQPALIARTTVLARTAAVEWADVIVRSDPGKREALVFVRYADGREVAAQRLSTGAQALLYLSLRVAMADQDGRGRDIAFPLICDDPLVHLDDDRALQAASILAAAATHRQVLLLTCHRRTLEAAGAMGALSVQI